MPCNEIRHVHHARVAARSAAIFAAISTAALLGACAGSSDRAAGTAPDTLDVHVASSLAVPLRAVLDSFARRERVVVRQENGGSLELARRITDLHRVPDLVVLADQEVFPERLMPSATSWYARFARNRMVIAYTARSRGGDELTASNWHEVLLRPDVLVGRADPTLAPAGYRALILFRLAERHYRRPGLAARLEARSPPRLMRANASELAALLSAGELDYIVEYESLARSNGLRYLPLPPEIDLGDAAHSAAYARDSVRVAGRGDTVTRVGAPILYGASVPRAAPHGDVGARALAFLLGGEGQALLRARSVDALATPVLVGDSVPAAVTAVVRP